MERLFVAFAGVLLAVVMRTLLPYVEKARTAAEKGESVPTWSQRYLFTGLCALFTSLIIAVLAFPTISVPAEPASLFYVFVVSFGYGWGVNDVYNKVLVDWR